MVLSLHSVRMQGIARKYRLASICQHECVSVYLGALLPGRGQANPKT